MKITFIYPGFENIGIEYLSAFLKKHGHTTSLIFDPQLFGDSFLRLPWLEAIFSEKNLINTALEREKPDLIAFSVVSSNYHWFTKVVHEIKTRFTIPIVAGGPHITAVPEHVLNETGIDFGVIGEGEKALLLLAESLANQKDYEQINNLVYLKKGQVKINPVGPPFQNLDLLPFPDKSIYTGTSYEKHAVYTILCMRGCPFSCSFCTNSLYNRLYKGKQYLRWRSVDHVIAELKRAQKHYQPELINIYDEIFALNDSWLQEFVEKYRTEIGLPYMAVTHPTFVNKKRAQLLAQSGCVKLDMGVQTINQKMRHQVLKRKESNSDIENALKILKNVGIHCSVDNILNIPGEKEENLVEMATFYNQHRPSILKFAWFSYFPGTEIVDIAVKMEELTHQEVDQINRGILWEQYSIATMSYKTTLIAKKFYLLFLLIQILPPQWIKKIIDRRWYHFLPSFLPSGVNYIVFKLFRKKTGNAEIMITRYKKHYVYYIPKIISRKIRNAIYAILIQ